MTKIKCKLIIHSNSIFLQQIYTGLFLLFKNGLIDLEQIILRKEKIADDDLFKDNTDHHLRVILNDDIKLHYDLKDGRGIYAEALEKSHYYFKRSYYPPYVESLGEPGRKIFPFGLNYGLFPSSIDKFALQRGFTLADGMKKISAVLYSLDTLNLNRSRYLSRINVMQSLPDYKAKPKIIFMVKVYDPYSDPNKARNEIEERIEINETRAKCIRLLKSEFGEDFYGGFYHDKTSIEKYSDCLIPQKNNSSKRNYINLLKNYPICISNAGLHGSIGWKFAEYIALSKAVVAEKMDFVATGDLENGKNYLEFDTPEQCVEHAVKLFQDQGLRARLMTSNARYYQSFLRPDVLILNTLLTALNAHHQSSQKH